MRTFFLDGHHYLASEKIGYGKRLYIIGEIRKYYLAENPGAPSDVQTLEQWMNEHAYEYGVQMSILRNVLEPAEGSPSVEEGFQNATAEEVGTILGFFAQTTPVKTNEQESTSKSGRANSRRQTMK